VGNLTGMKSTGLQQGLRLVRRHPRAAARVGRYAARHPRRAAMVVRLAREAPDAARRLNATAKDPTVQRQLRQGRRSLSKAGARLTKGDVSGAVADEQFWTELRRAVGALAAGYALAQAPPTCRRRRGRLALVSFGVIGGAAYAAYRITRGRDSRPPSDW
jgi:hypothetical protein